jgi:hypothetical protein
MRSREKETQVPRRSGEAIPGLTRGMVAPDLPLDRTAALPEEMESEQA